MHELDFTKGEAAIAYTGEAPWHGYGAVMEEDQPLEVWLQQAGMDYKVIARPVAFVNNRLIDKDGNVIQSDGTLANQPTFTTIKDRKALCRDDTDDQLAIVGKNYKVVQPREVLYFFEDLVRDQGFKLNTAGVLSGGRRVWALAETGRDFTIPGSSDQLGAYLLLATSYDGKFSTTAQFTSIRVVCNNTLSFSLQRGETQDTGIIRIPHMSDFQANEVKGQLGLLGEGWNAFQDNVIKLADVKITKRQAVEFFLELLGVTEEEAAEGKKLLNAKKLIAFYESGPGSDFVTAKNTTWGLVNAVSFFADHGRRAHNNGTRFNSAAFGEGAVLKRRAFDKALEIAEAA